MYRIYKLLFFVVLGHFLHSQDLQINRSDIIDNSFIVFISPYTNPESLEKTIEELFELGYNMTLDTILIDSNGRIESIAISLQNICDGFNQKVPSIINFRSTPFELGVLFLGDQCSHGGFQTDINRLNTTLGFFFPNQQAPHYFKNLIGAHPAYHQEEFQKNHILWESD